MAQQMAPAPIPLDWFEDVTIFRTPPFSPAGWGPQDSDKNYGLW